MIKECVACHSSYTPRFLTGKAVDRQKYCSKKCRMQNFALRSPYSNISSGTVGAIAELVVSANLMKKGYEVYRALSPSSSCDVLAIKDGKVYTFEVRTGYRNKNGSIGYSRQNVRAERIAVYIHSLDEIHYFPLL